MSNAKQSKVSKTTAAAVETAKNCLLDMCNAISARDGSVVAARDAMVKLIKTKVIIGDLRVCANAQFFRDSLCMMENPATRKPYSAAVASNYLSAIRRSIKTGEPLDLNKSRSDAKAKAAGQSKTPAKKDKAALVEPNVMDDDSEMATDEGKTPAVKPGAFKSNDDAIAALKTAIKNVRASCTLKQWEAIQTLYPQLGKLAD